MKKYIILYTTIFWNFYSLPLLHVQMFVQTTIYVERAQQSTFFKSQCIGAISTDYTDVLYIYDQLCVRHREILRNKGFLAYALIVIHDDICFRPGGRLANCRYVLKNDLNKKFHGTFSKELKIFITSIIFKYL